MPAAVIGGVIAGAGAIGSAAIGSHAASKAAKAQVAAADKSAEVQRYMFDQAREDQAPWRQVGGGALYKLADLYGIPRPIIEPAATPAMPGTGQAGPTGGQQFDWNGHTVNIPGFGGVTIPGAGGSAGGTPAPRMTEGYDDWQQSPGYEFRRDEGLKAIQRMGAARGARFSPQTWRAGARYASNLASDEYDKYTNGLRAMAGLGQTSAAQTGALGVQTGQGIANAYTQAGNARASSYGAQGAIMGNMFNNLGYLGQQFMGGGFGGGGGYGLASGPSFGGADFGGFGRATFGGGSQGNPPYVLSAGGVP